ncbi:MAG: histidinol-phosphate transaminase [Flavobacteriales bacterium]
MVSIPKNIEELVSYKPGKPIQEIVREFNLSEWAVLWNNENNLGASPKVAEAIAEASKNIHRYPDPASLQLREKLAELNDCSVDQVMVDNGSESLLDNLFRSFFDKGDELLTCEGTFVAVYIWAKSNNKPVAKIPLGRGYRFDVKKLIESVTPQTKAIYLANPNNPTGAMITADELNELIDFVSEDVLIIVDEAYYEYAKVISPDYPDSFKLRKPNVITLRTLSKAYAIAGMRIGYALGPDALSEAMTKVKMTFAPSNIAQAAAIAALNDEHHLKHSVTLNKAALQQFYTAIHEAEINYVPSYGNFVMLDLETPEFAKEFTHQMMKKGVFVRHLPAFGLPHCVRVSTGTEKENMLFSRSIR